MPSRLASIGIVLFWLATAGWFVHREIWPRFAADGPAPFSIELTDEAVRQIIPVRWTLSRNGVPLTSVRTNIEYRDADDSFLLVSTIGSATLSAAPVEVRLKSFTNEYRVNRAGQVLGIKTDIELEAFRMACRAVLTAEVRNGVAHTRCELTYPGGHTILPTDPIPVTNAGFLNPLHPVAKLLGLRPGQRWIQPVSDPLADAQRAAIETATKSMIDPKMVDLVAPLLRRTGPRSLTAQVVGPHDLVWNRQVVSCLIIEYRGDDSLAKTWVRVDDGAVLKQEATVAGETMTLVRE